MSALEDIRCDVRIRHSLQQLALQSEKHGRSVADVENNMSHRYPLPTEEQLAVIRRCRAADLAKHAGVDIRTARAAVAGDAVHPVILAALVTAAKQQTEGKAA